MGQNSFLPVWVTILPGFALCQDAIVYYHFPFGPCDEKLL